MVGEHIPLGRHGSRIAMRCENVVEFLFLYPIYRSLILFQYLFSSPFFINHAQTSYYSHVGLR